MTGVSCEKCGHTMDRPWRITDLYRASASPVSIAYYRDQAIITGLYVEGLVMPCKPDGRK